MLYYSCSWRASTYWLTHPALIMCSWAMESRIYNVHRSWCTGSPKVECTHSKQHYSSGKTLYKISFATRSTACNPSRHFNSHVITTLQRAAFANPISQCFPIRSSVSAACGMGHVFLRISQHAIYMPRPSSCGELASSA